MQRGDDKAVIYQFLPRAKNRMFSICGGAGVMFCLEESCLLDGQGQVTDFHSLARNRSKDFLEVLVSQCSPTISLVAHFMGLIGRILSH